MTTRFLAFAGVVLLWGCSGNGSGGMGGGSGGSDGSDGGDGGTGLQYVHRFSANGSVGVAFSEKADASDLSFQPVNRAFDGGVVRSILLEPFGLRFAPTAFVSRSLRFEARELEDGGIPIPVWALLVNDGGAEPANTVTTFGADTDAGVAGFVMATVERLYELQPRSQLVGRLEQLTAGTVFEVGETVRFSGRLDSRSGETMTGVISINGSAEVTGTSGSSAFTATPTTNAQASFLCVQPGAATITLQADVTLQSSRFTFAPTQKVQLVRRVFCRAPGLPNAMPPDEVGASLTAELRSPPLETDAGHLLNVFAAAMADRSTVDPSMVKAKLTLPCGRGSRPCELNTEYEASLEITNAGPKPLLTRGPTVVSAGEPLMIADAMVDEPGYPLNVPKTMLFRLTCLAQGRGPLSVRVDVRLENLEPSRILEVDLGVVQCGGSIDALLLADQQKLTRTGTTWTAAATGVQASVLVASDPLGLKVAALSKQSVGYDNVTNFQSRHGAPRLKFVSSLQMAFFEYNGGRYGQKGLMSTPAFAATDSLTVTGLDEDGGTAFKPDGGSMVLTVPAAGALPAFTQLFGPLAGYATPVRLVDGTFDVLYVSVGSPSPRMGEGGVFRTVRAADMVLDGGYREAPVLDPASIRALSAWGIDAGTVYIAALRQRDADGFFKESDAGVRVVPVQAGRMVQVNVSDLSP